MKIFFFGASDLGYKCCETLINSKFHIVGIYTIPQQFKISYSKDKPVKNYLFKDFHFFKKKFGIPVYDYDSKVNNLESVIEKFQPDLLIVIGWYYMIPKRVREIAPLGCIGIHGSLLPKYRGGAPLVWAMINGEKTAGLTLFFFEDGVDNGDIIDQKRFEIAEKDTIKDVLRKLEKASIEVLLDNLPKIQLGSVKRIEQDESQATYVPQRKPEDGLINWNWESSRIKNFIRAQTKPYPGAFTIINGKKITIWDADIEDI